MDEAQGLGIMQRVLSAMLLAAMLGLPGRAIAQNFDDNASVTSPGGTKIINAMYDGQKDPLPENLEPLSKEGIAAMKSGTGWGKLFQNLKDLGYYGDEYRNLGQLISHFNRLERPHSDNLQRTSKGQIRPERPTKPTRIEKFERPSRPDRPNRPNRPGRP